jgi:hypothetical protein
MSVFKIPLIVKGTILATLVSAVFTDAINKIIDNFPIPPIGKLRRERN